MWDRSLLRGARVYLYPLKGKQAFITAKQKRPMLYIIYNNI